MPEGFTLQAAPDLAKPEAIKAFRFTDRKAWRINANDDGGPTLELFAASDYKPKHRSPYNIALLKGKAFGDVVIDGEACSTVPPAPNQDMVFVYGYQSPTRFCYTHIAVRPDGKAHHNCFIVNDADRRPFATSVSDGVTWGQNRWHRVRIERIASAGTIRVFFDDMNNPIMMVADKTFASGHVGFGSFDDKGKVRDIRIYAPSAEERGAAPFVAGE